MMADVIGILGVSLILMCYGFLQMGKMSQSSLQYSLTNLIGAILILLSLFVHWNLASVVIETFWILISLFGVLRWYRRM